MKAIFFYNHGDIDVLEYGDFPTPEPGPGQVLVRLKAAALNRLDLWVREGWPGLKLEYPHIPGADGAGEISALGSGVNDWSVGDRVVINSNLSCGTCQNCLAGFDNRFIFAKHLSLIGSTMGTHHDFMTVMELVFSGRLNPILDQTYPLSEAGAAQQRLAYGDQMEKITLAID